MLTITFVFLGIAGLIVAALCCCSAGKRAGKYVEVDLAALHAAAVCLSAGRRAADGGATTTGKEPTWGEKLKWQEMKEIWMRGYGRCQEQAIVRQKRLRSWARTFALCAAVCIVGVVLRAEIDECVSASRIWAGVGQPHLIASKTSQLDLPRNMSIPPTTRSAQQ